MASSASDLYEDTFSRAKRSFEEEGERRGSPAAGFSRVSSDEGSRAFGDVYKGNALTNLAAIDGTTRGAAAVGASIIGAQGEASKAALDVFGRLNQPRSGGGGDDGIWSAVGSIGGSFLGPIGSAIGGSVGKWLG